MVAGKNDSLTRKSRRWFQDNYGSVDARKYLDESMLWDGLRCYLGGIGEVEEFALKQRPLPRDLQSYLSRISKEANAGWVERATGHGRKHALALATYALGEIYASIRKKGHAPKDNLEQEILQRVVRRLVQGDYAPNVATDVLVRSLSLSSAEISAARGPVQAAVTEISKATKVSASRLFVLLRDFKLNQSLPPPEVARNRLLLLFLTKGFGFPTARARSALKVLNPGPGKTRSRAIK